MKGELLRKRCDLASFDPPGSVFVSLQWIVRQTHGDSMDEGWPVLTRMYRTLRH